MGCRVGVISDASWALRHRIIWTWLPEKKSLPKAELEVTVLSSLTLSEAVIGNLFLAHHGAWSVASCTPALVIVIDNTASEAWPPPIEGKGPPMLGPVPSGISV